MLLYYIRHGDPIYDPDSLTPLGQRQAEAIGKRLSTYGLDKVFTSTSNRAKQTAVPTCEMLNIKPVELDWTNEANAWRYFAVKTDSGHHTWCFYVDKYLQKFAASDVLSRGRKWYESPLFDEHDFSAGAIDFQQETDNFMAQLGYEHDLEHNIYNAVNPTNERVALFAHQGFGLAFLSCLLDIPYPLFVSHFDLSHSSMTVIHFGEGKGPTLPKCWQLSNDSHIYAEGLPTKYNNGLYI